MPACGPPRSLSPENVTTCAPAVDARRDGRLVPDLDERARAEVVDEHQAATLGQSRELPCARLLGEADHAEVGLVDAQERGRPLADRSLVVGEPRAVGRAHLDELRARAREDVGDAEAVADLDQLPAGDDHLASLGQRGEREEDGGGVVVDDERGLRAGQLAEQRGDVILARAARSRLDVVLEVRVAGADLLRRARARPRRAARVRGSCARRRRWRSGPGAGAVA